MEGKVWEESVETNWNPHLEDGRSVVFVVIVQSHLEVVERSRRHPEGLLIIEHDGRRMTMGEEAAVYPVIISMKQVSKSIVDTYRPPTRPRISAAQAMMKTKKMTLQSPMTRGLPMVSFMSRSTARQMIAPEWSSLFLTVSIPSP